MVSPHIRQEVWNELLHINQNCRYYEAIHSRAVKTYFWLRVLTLGALALSLSVVVNLLPWGNDFGKVAVVVLVAGLTIWDAVSNYPKRAAIGNLVHFQFAMLRVEINDLWLSVNKESLNDDQVITKMSEIGRKTVELENWVGLSEIELDVKLNQKASDEADRDVADRFRKLGNAEAD